MAAQDLMIQYLNHEIFLSRAAQTFSVVPQLLSVKIY